MSERHLFSPFQLEVLEAAGSEYWYLTVSDPQGNTVILLKRPRGLAYAIQRRLFGGAAAWIDSKMMWRQMTSKTVDR